MMGKSSLEGAKEEKGWRSSAQRTEVSLRIKRRSEKRSARAREQETNEETRTHLVPDYRVGLPDPPVSSEHGEQEVNERPEVLLIVDGELPLHRTRTRTKRYQSDSST